MYPHHEDQMMSAKRTFRGTSIPAGGSTEEENTSVSEETFEQIDNLLTSAYDLSHKVPTTFDRLQNGTATTNQATTVKEISDNEAKVIESLQETTFHLRQTFALFKKG
jgi:hypothetical protein